MTREATLKLLKRQEGLCGLSQRRQSMDSIEAHSDMATVGGGWQPVIGDIEFKPEADRLVDLRPLVDQIVAAVGSNATARLLGVDPAQVSRWRSGGPISTAMGRRVLDLHAVFTRMLRLFSRDVAAQWLVGAEPLLGGARPIDVLALCGSAPVVLALDGIAQGAYS